MIKPCVKGGSFVNRQKAMDMGAFDLSQRSFEILHWSRGMRTH